MPEKEDILEKKRLQEKAEREAFCDMALRANQFINDPRHEAFRELFNTMLKINMEILDMIANEQSNPNSQPKGDLTGMALQAANISGQNLAFRNLLDAPGKFIDQWDKYLEMKKKREEGGRKTP